MQDFESKAKRQQFSVQRAKLCKQSMINHVQAHEEDCKQSMELWQKIKAMCLNCRGIREIAINYFLVSILVCNTDVYLAKSFSMLEFLLSIVRKPGTDATQSRLLNPIHQIYIHRQILRRCEETG